MIRWTPVSAGLDWSAQPDLRRRGRNKGRHSHRWRMWAEWTQCRREPGPLRFNAVIDHLAFVSNDRYVLSRQNDSLQVFLDRNGSIPLLNTGKETYLGGDLNRGFWRRASGSPGSDTLTLSVRDNTTGLDDVLSSLTFHTFTSDVLVFDDGTGSKAWLARALYAQEGRAPDRARARAGRARD